MPLVDTLNSISTLMDELIDFSINDEYISKSFEDFLIKNEIDTNRQSEIQNCLISYILDEKTKDNIRVIDYFLQKNPDRDKKFLNAFKNSFISVFQVNKILKNAYKVTCLANEKDFEIIPLVKMTNLRAIGLNDYIKARMIEIDNVFYLLEIFECFGEFREYFANTETVKCLVKYPKSQVMYNGEKLKELQKSTGIFYNKFIETFGCDEIVTSNTLADDLIKDFGAFVEENIPISKEKYAVSSLPIGYFELNQTKEDDFIKSAQGGFSSSEKPYDIGFFADKNSGLYIVPFLHTVNEIFSKGTLDNENEKNCIKYFISSDKVSPNLIFKKEKEFKSFIPLVNEALGEAFGEASGKKFKDTREIVSYFKEEWLTSENFSPTTVLYNSKTFEKLIGYEEKKEALLPQKAGRNELCPCGSGKKYKNCCALKT